MPPNDPAKGAAAIIATVRAPAAPLRLPLAEEAVARIDGLLVSRDQVVGTNTRTPSASSVS